MQGWKYWKNIEGLSHDGPAHLQVTDLPESQVCFGNSCSLSFGECYRLKSVKCDSSHPPWEAPAAGLSHSSQWLWSPRLQPLLSITQGMWGKDRTSSPHPLPSPRNPDWFITCQGALEMLCVPGFTKGCCYWKSREMIECHQYLWPDTKTRSAVKDWIKDTVLKIQQ